MNQSDLLWEILETEAPIKFYIGNCERPAFLLFPKHHWAASKSKVALYMNSVAKIGDFRSIKEALEFLKEKIEKHTTGHIKLYMVREYGRDAGRRVLFAESKLAGEKNEEEKEARETKTLL